MAIIAPNYPAIFAAIGRRRRRQKEPMTDARIFDPDFDGELSPDDPALGLLIAGAMLMPWLMDDPDNADNWDAGMAIAHAQEAHDPDAFLAAVKRGRDLLARWCENDERTREEDMGPAEEAETLAEVDTLLAAYEEAQ